MITAILTIRASPRCFPQEHVPLASYNDPLPTKFYSLKMVRCCHLSFLYVYGPLLGHSHEYKRALGQQSEVVFLSWKKIRKTRRFMYREQFPPKYGKQLDGLLKIPGVKCGTTLRYVVLTFWYIARVKLGRL